MHFLTSALKKSWLCWLHNFVNILHTIEFHASNGWFMVFKLYLKKAVIYFKKRKINVASLSFWTVHSFCFKGKWPRFGGLVVFTYTLCFFQSLGKSERHRPAQERPPAPAFWARWTGQRPEGGMWAAFLGCLIQEPERGSLSPAGVIAQVLSHSFEKTGLVVF